MSEVSMVDILADEYDESHGCQPMLLFWYVEPGTPVAEGQELCEVESAKAVTVITAPCDGVLAETTLREGDQVGSGAVMGRIQAEGA